ncbi:MAG: hypothetical protein WA814_00065 [Candidatus Baltobacteraceae bacterium]|jgi:hypothetical protein
MLYRYAKGSIYGLIGYLGLNVVLLVVEAVWHPIGRLAAWDVATIQSLFPH